MTVQRKVRRQGITVLGSTGSIGMNTLEVVALHPERFHVVALTANTQVDRLFEQCKQFKPKIAVLSDSEAAENLKKNIKAANLDIEVLAGVDGLQQAAIDKQADIVMAAIVGAAGLLPALAAVKSGKRVLFANKEPLVMSGKIFIDEAISSKATLLPIDSEHNAIFQCMPDSFHSGQTQLGVKKIMLTCSGGPFLETPQELFDSITPEQACAHPKWNMGRKISVDSATLMNKGLEVIEACWLFGMDAKDIEVVIHPQSVIHSMVEYIDGSVLAQLGNPDMRIPIAHAIAWPERIESGVEQLDLVDIAQLNFQKPDRKKFPCLDLAYQAAKTGGTAPAILNAANEIAVQAFLDREIKFTAIPQIIEYTLEQSDKSANLLLEEILKSDRQSRIIARDWIDTHTTTRKRSS